MLLLRGRDEGLRCGSTPCVAGDRDNLESSALQLLPQPLPDRQVKPAASPGGPEEQEDLLAQQLFQSVLPPGKVRQREIGRLLRREPRLPVPPRRSEVPDRVILIAGERLLDQPGELGEVEPGGRGVVANERTATPVRHRDADL